MTEHSQKAPIPPARWLVVTVSATLQAVAAENYVCYGGASVPRYGITQPPPRPQTPDPSVLCAELFIRTAGDGVVRCAELDVQFRVTERSDKQVIWGWFDPTRWLHVYWVWDFFRLLSHAVVRAGLPAPDHASDVARADLIAAMRAITPGDSLTFKVQSACGNILQTHPITTAAAEWQPGG